ncbi:MAG: peptidoglycan-binding domain-containing protein [Christensenellales bacterium]|jgi:peptidoglycan hydrolase-like protein with peptidoglycan-binding domain
MKKAFCFWLVILLVFSLSAGVYAQENGHTTPTPSMDFPKEGTLASGAQGVEVLRLQARLRELNYLIFVPTGNFAGMTISGLHMLQQINSLSATGELAPEDISAVYAARAIRAPLPSSAVLNGPGSTRQQAAGASIDWESASSLIQLDKKHAIIDFNTSVEFEVYRTGGVSFAYIEPCTDGDAAALKGLFAENSWEKRAVLINIGGVLYAASMSGAPYGSDVVKNNNMDGHVELFLDGSVSELNGLPDMDHQRMIQRASGN